MTHFFRSRPDRALDTLARRAERTRTSYVRRSMWARSVFGSETIRYVWRSLRHSPSRVWLHLVVALLVPGAIIANQFLPARSMVSLENAVPAASLMAPQTPLMGAEVPLSLGPIDIDTGDTLAIDDLPAPDSAFADIMALPEIQQARSRQEVLAPLTVSRPTLGDSVNLRTGPGQVYDVVDTLAAGTVLVLEHVAEDWFSVRTMDGRQGWVAAEVVADADSARGILAPATDIPPPPPPKVATVAQDELNVRDGPGVAYVKLAGVDSGATIDLLSRYEDWFEVRLPDGTIGWVRGEYLQIAQGVIERLEVFSNPPDPKPLLVTEADGKINLRGGPGTAYPKVGSTAAGTRLDLIGRYKEWIKVRTADGTLAWATSEVLPVHPYIARRIPLTNEIPALAKPQRPASQAGQTPRLTRTAPSLSAAQAGSIASFALQFTGTPYVWGGSRPGAFDCSGFIKYVYGQYGLSMPHSAAGQYSQKYGTFIDRANLQPGDIVFFANTYKRGISHVGIYVGGGVVAQALAPGTPLSAVSMNSAYWNAKYYGALRPRV